MNFDVKFQPYDNVIFRFSILSLLLISLSTCIMVHYSPNGKSASVIPPPPYPSESHQIDLYLMTTKSREFHQYPLIPEILLNKYHLVPTHRGKIQSTHISREPNLGAWSTPFNARNIVQINTTSSLPIGIPSNWLIFQENQIKGLDQCHLMPDYLM